MYNNSKPFIKIILIYEINLLKQISFKAKMLIMMKIIHSFKAKHYNTLKFIMDKKISGAKNIIILIEIRKCYME